MWARSALPLLGGALLVLAAAAPAQAKRMRVQVNETGRQVTVDLKPVKEPIRYAVKLNGKRITKIFDYTPPSGRKVVLGLDDGLEFGRNRLKVKALYASGAKIKRVRKFNVSRSRPLAGAPDIGRTHAGVSVRLAARSRPKGSSAGGRTASASTRGGVSYRWSIDRAPDDSEAKLRNPSSRRPRFRPDVAGIYRLRLTVSHRRSGRSPRQGGAATQRQDVAQLAVIPMEVTRAGNFIATEPLDTDGDPTSLTLHSNSNAVQEPISSAPIGTASPNAPVATMLFDRSTLGLVEVLHTGAAGGDVQAISGAIESHQDQATEAGSNLLAVTAGANVTLSTAFETFLNANTGQSFTFTDPQAPFWAIWIPGAENGWVNVNPAGQDATSDRLAGVLVEDASEQFTFRPSNVPTFGVQNPLLRFHMDSSGISFPAPFSSTPTKLGAPASSCPNAGRGGYQLVVLWAKGPSILAPQTHDTFWTNGCTLEASAAAAEALENAIPESGFGPNGQPLPPFLVFLQSVGAQAPQFGADPPPCANPGSAACQQAPDRTETALNAVAGKITDLGGSGNAFEPSETFAGPYSFVGRTWHGEEDARVSTEVAGSQPDSPPTQLDGVLDRDRQWRLSPTLGTSTAGISGDPIDKSLAINSASAYLDPGNEYRPSFPGQDDPAWQKAMQYAGSTVLGFSYDATRACYVPSNVNKPDVRWMYCSGGSSASGCNGFWASQGSTLSAAKPPFASLGFDEKTWTDVVTQLKIEFGYLDTLNCTIGNLQNVYETVAGQNSLVDVGSIVSSVQGHLNAEKKAVSGNAFGIIEGILDILGAITGPIGAVPYAAAGTMQLIGAIGTKSSGSKQLGPFAASVNLDKVISGELQDAAGALPMPRDQIASDWSRLRQFGESGLSIAKADLPPARTQLSYGTYAFAWKTVIASAFPPTHLGPTRTDNSPPQQEPGQPPINAANQAPVDYQNYVCWGDESTPNSQFPTTPFSSWAKAATAFTRERPTPPVNPLGQEVYALAAVVEEGGGDKAFVAPTADTLEQIFSPIANPNAATPLPPVQNDGTVTPLGVSKARFYSSVISRAGFNNEVYELGLPRNGYCFQSFDG